MPASSFDIAPATLAVRQKLARARELSRVKTALPAFFNPLFRKQGPVNSSLLDCVQQLNDSLSELNRHLNEQVEPRERETNAALTLLRALPPALAAMDLRGAEHGAELAALDNQRLELKGEVAALTQAQAGSSQRLEEFAQRSEGRIESLENQLKRSEAQLAQQAKEIAALLGALSAQDEKYAQLLSRIAQLESASVAQDTRLMAQQSLDLALQRAERIRGDIFTALHQATTPEQKAVVAQTADQNAREEVGASFDSFYLKFENRFRGTREQIKTKQAVYIPVVEKTAQKLGLANADARLLDIGCGRGEWLELARERGFSAAGVDFNARMVETCRELGLTATQDDAIAYLRRQAPGSLHFITTFHVIEHLSLQQRFELYQEVLRVLPVGGTAVFETPNPENIIVGSCNFYFDPTHVRPLVPPSEEFVLREIGFSDVRIERLHPFDPQHRATSPAGQVTDQFNGFFYGPQDFALICVK